MIITNKTKLWSLIPIIPLLLSLIVIAPSAYNIQPYRAEISRAVVSSHEITSPPENKNLDYPPTLVFFSDTQHAQTVAVLTATAVDAGDNPGIQWIKIYEDNNLLSTKNCNGATSCTFVFTKIETNRTTHSYYAKTKDLGGNVVQSQTIVIEFEGLNHPPHIDDYVPDDLTPKLNVSDTLHFEVWASDPDSDPLNYVWTFDGQQVSTTSSWDFLPNINDIGTHEVKAIVSDGEYNVSQTWNVVVLKIAATCSLSFNPPSPISYDQQPFVASCSCTNPEAAEQLWRDGQDVTVENNQPVTLGAKSTGYSYVCNVSETAHYQAATDSASYVINKAQTTLNLTALPSWNVVYGATTTVRCTPNNFEVSLNLYRNGQLVNNPDIQQLAASSYDYVCSATESQNWTAALETNTLTVNKAASEVNLLLNGQDSNITVAVNQQVELNGTLVVPSKSQPGPNPDDAVPIDPKQIRSKTSPTSNLKMLQQQPQQSQPKQYHIELWLDGNKVAEGDHNVIYTTSFSAPGLHNATLLYPETQNYSSSFETHWIEVEADGEAPVVSLVFPPNNAVVAFPNVTISYNVTDNIDNLLDCKIWSNVSGNWQVDGTQQTANSTSNSWNYTALANGVYQWNVQCVDDAANAAFAPSNWTFIVNVDAEAPLISDISIEPPVAPQLYLIEINATVTDNVAVDTVLALITKPDSSTTVKTMNPVAPDIYACSFGDTNLIGRYNVTIWANDSSGNVASNSSSFEIIQGGIHDIAVESLELVKEVNGINKSIENSTAYLNDSIYVRALLHNLGNVNETVNVSLQNNIGVLDSQFITINAGDVEIVIFVWSAQPDGWHTIKVRTEPVAGETNCSNNELSKNVRLWAICDVIDCSIFGPRTQYDSYSLGQPFLVRTMVQNLWNNESFKDLKLELETTAGLQIINPWPAKQWFDLGPSQFVVANWNVTSTMTGNQSITALAGNREYSKTKYINIL